MDFQYNLTQWLLFFMCIVFSDGVLRPPMVDPKEKVCQSGLYAGPFLPLYGSGAVMMLFVTLPVRDSLVLSFVFGAIGATILEYLTEPVWSIVSSTVLGLQRQSLQSAWVCLSGNFPGLGVSHHSHDPVIHEPSNQCSCLSARRFRIFWLRF